jgi:hypothetical protein
VTGFLEAHPGALLGGGIHEVEKWAGGIDDEAAQFEDGSRFGGCSLVASSREKGGVRRLRACCERSEEESEAE